MSAFGGVDLSAIVLAAGRGTRMKSLTDNCPKPMLPLAGRPMLAHLMDRLAAAGIRQACVVIGYRGEMIREYFAANPPPGIELHYAVQGDPTGTGSAALLAKEFAAGDPFLLTFGDILVDPQVYSALFALKHGAEMVLALTNVEDPYRGGAVYVEDGQVVRIVEKPPKGTSTTNFLCAGVYVFEERLFGALAGLRLSARGEYDLTDAISDAVHGGRTVRYFEVPGFWRDVGRPEDLQPASDYIRQL
jgi:NDP-sugar pyrophosphorylase family protein